MTAAYSTFIRPKTAFATSRYWGVLKYDVCNSARRGERCNKGTRGWSLRENAAREEGVNKSANFADVMCKRSLSVLLVELVGEAEVVQLPRVGRKVEGVEVRPLAVPDE